MNIAVACRPGSDDGIISFKAETQAEGLQLKRLLEQMESKNINAFQFTGDWEDNGGGITVVTKLKPKS